MSGTADASAVLVVDDDPALGRMLRVLLESDSFRVRVARDGEEALGLLAEFTPDVILLDLQMPVMDGRSFYRELRRRGYLTPVIVLSAYNAERARTELGADDALAKPFNPDEVGERVRRILGVGAGRARTQGS